MTIFNERPPIHQQVTFLYFNDIEKAVEFYGKTLGLRPTFEQDWVKIYALSSSSFIGLVSADRGAHKPSNDKPVMISLVVDEIADVDRWYEYLKSLRVKMRSAPHDNTQAGVRAFGFFDSEGYTLEVFSWLKK